MTTEREWFPPSERLPEDGQKVTWLDSAGNAIDGVYYRRLWFPGDDMTMYCYYTPVFWKHRKE